jgi:hypothetical protein
VLLGVQSLRATMRENVRGKDHSNPAYGKMLVICHNTRERETSVSAGITSTFMPQRRASACV